MADSAKVYVVTRWRCGYGGDDDRELLAVCSTPAIARAVALVYGDEDCAVVDMRLDRVGEVSWS